MKTTKLIFYKQKSTFAKRTKVLEVISLSKCGMMRSLESPARVKSRKKAYKNIVFYLILFYIFKRCPYSATNSSAKDVRVTPGFLPPFPSVLFAEGKVKFVFLAETIGLFSGQKKMTFFSALRIYGIAYNGDIFKSYKEVWNETTGKSKL